MATPWIDSSSDISTKSCRLMKPRTGGGAVTTSRVSPASGSTSRCRRPGLDSGTVTLASAGSLMFRIAISGCVGACIVSAKVSVQFGAARLCLAGQRRHLRTVESNPDRLPLVQRHQADVGDDRPVLAADRLDIDRRGGIEHQPHRIGAAKQRRRCRGRKGKCQAQAVAVAPGDDTGRRAVGGGFGFRRRFGSGSLDFRRDLDRGSRRSAVAQAARGFSASAAAGGFAAGSALVSALGLRPASLRRHRRRCSLDCRGAGVPRPAFPGATADRRREPPGPLPVRLQQERPAPWRLTPRPARHRLRRMTPTAFPPAGTRRR